MACRFPDLIKSALDLALIVLSATWCWVVALSAGQQCPSLVGFLAVVVTARLAIYYVLGLHRTSWLYVSRYEIVRLAVSAALGPLVIAGLAAVLPAGVAAQALVRPMLLFSVEPAFYLLLLSGARISARALYNSHLHVADERRVLIVGAGATGRALAFQIAETTNSYALVGFLDDQPRYHGRRMRGFPVCGSLSDLERVAGEQRVDEVVVAIPSLQPHRLREILGAARQAGVAVRILPPLRELVEGRPTLGELRDVRMEDLLPRAPVRVDRAAVLTQLKDRTVLVTGGGGSIGSELCRQVAAVRPRTLLVLGRGENSIFEITQQLAEVDGAVQVVPIICDVRDTLALERVFERWRPEVVLHAAAHKHVPLMEQHPCEAVKNNIIGTRNVAEMAVKYPVERFVLVSTDKAVDPSSIMGATKRLSEMLVQDYAARHGANMVCTRFGNVLGSRGSVVPTMQRQIRRRLPVTVTDPEMTRYFMTIPEAVELILGSCAMGGSGEIFILDMGRPVRILDLASDLIRLSGLVPDQDVPIRIIGRRPGEKVQERLLTVEESQSCEQVGPFFRVRPQLQQSADLRNMVEALRIASEAGDEAQVVDLLRGTFPELRWTAPARRLNDSPASSRDAVSSEASVNLNNGARNGVAAAEVGGVRAAREEVTGSVPLPVPRRTVRHHGEVAAWS